MSGLKPRIPVGHDILHDHNYQHYHLCHDHQDYDRHHHRHLGHNTAPGVGNVSKSALNKEEYPVRKEAAELNRHS